MWQRVPAMHVIKNSNYALTGFIQKLGNKIQ